MEEALRYKNHENPRDRKSHTWARFNTKKVYKSVKLQKQMSR
jgi:hypothetical protein